VTNYYVPNAGALASWDTAIFISNTSMDPFGTASESGKCTFYFYSRGAGESGTYTPVKYTTPTIAAGGTNCFMVSNTPAAGVTAGYAIAVCNFRNAHGAAYVVDNANGLGNWQLAASMPALVLATPRPATDEALGW
jgi:hypothetical protein